MNFLVKTASLLCLTLFLTSTLSAQNFLDWADYPQNTCGNYGNVSIEQTTYNGSPALIVTTSVNDQHAAIINITAPGNGYVSNNGNWTYDGSSQSAMIGYGEGIGYGNTPESEQVTCYFYFSDGSSCSNICTVEIDF